MNTYNELFISTTDTVVGIGAKATKENLEAIYKIKNRPKSKGVILMVGNLDQARKLEGWNDNAEELAKKYWPGRTTLVLNKDVAVRMPNQQGLLDLINNIGTIYMTSANISGEPQLTYDEAVEKFKEIKQHYNFGEGSGQPSTIIDVNTKEVLR